jgi:hypothetical protein
MPSFLIFSCKVERFIPRRAAAPFALATTLPVSRKAPEDLLALGLGQRHRRGGLLWGLRDSGLQVAEGT